MTDTHASIVGKEIPMPPDTDEFLLDLIAGCNTSTDRVTQAFVTLYRENGQKQAMIRIVAQLLEDIE